MSDLRVRARRIELYSTSYGTVLPLLQTGKIKVIAMLGDSRIPLAPEAGGHRFPPVEGVWVWLNESGKRRRGQGQTTRP